MSTKGFLRILRSYGLIFPLAATLATPSLAAIDYPTKFSNTGTVANTRHNMTQRSPTGAPVTGPNGTLQSIFMDGVRNDYREVCVYCHTPHAASPNVSLPLWNRTIVATTYTTYNQLGTGTLTQPISQPGANSLACLSCHDGQTAIDSIINMPGSGRYNPNQATAVDVAFLNSWNQVGQGGGGPPGQGALPGENHHNNLVECAACHGIGSVPSATSFLTFLIGTDLRDDHPIGIRFPTGSADFFQPGAISDKATYFDNNGNGRMDKDEIRLYRTGDNYQVECATCHDPHGVPSLGAGSAFNKTFLRVANDNSQVCLTCHNK